MTNLLFATDKDPMGHAIADYYKNGRAKLLRFFFFPHSPTNFLLKYFTGYHTDRQPMASTVKNISNTSPV